VRVTAYPSATAYRTSITHRTVVEGGRSEWRILWIFMNNTGDSQGQKSIQSSQMSSCIALFIMTTSILETPQAKSIHRFKGSINGYHGSSIEDSGHSSNFFSGNWVLYHLPSFVTVSLTHFVCRALHLFWTTEPASGRWLPAKQSRMDVWKRYRIEQPTLVVV